MRKLGFECDTSRCRGQNYCEAYNTTGLEFTLTLGSDFEATIRENDLLLEIKDEDYNCVLSLFNAGSRYIFGNQFLRHFYTIYDVDNSQVALGQYYKAPIVPDEPETVVPPDHQGKEYTMSYWNLAVFITSSLFVLAFVVMVQKCCKKKESLLPEDSSVAADRNADMDEQREWRY